MSYRLVDIMQRKEREIEKEKEREKKDRNLCLYTSAIFLLLIVASVYLDFNRILLDILSQNVLEEKHTSGFSNFPNLN